MFSKRFYCLWPTVIGSYKPERDCSCTMRQRDIFDPLIFAKEDAVVEEVISKEMTKKEQYKHADELAIAKSDGCAPTKRALSLLLTTLQTRSQLKTSLSDRSVTLFNFHSTRFADHLIQRNIRSLVIVESAHVYARKAKEFARSKKQLSGNVDAYRADMCSLLGIGRKKLSRLPVQLLEAGRSAEKNPLFLKTRDALDESGNLYSRSPILISSLPLVSQQTSVLDSLQKNLLLHYAKIDTETIFGYGAIELITFLSAGVLSHLLSSLDNRLAFISHAHRRYSAVFTKLFQLQVLHSRGFSRQSFHPPIPLQKALPHEKKLRELSFTNGVQYAVSIRPSLSVSLYDRFIDSYDGEGNTINERSLLAFSLWMHLIGKEKIVKKTGAVISNICPESASRALQIVDGSQRIGEIPNLVLEQVFLIVQEELENSSHYKKYVGSLTIKRDI